MSEELAVAQAARALLDSAKSHKRAVGYHRKELRRTMQDLAALQARCAAAGIRLQVKA